jgi:putative transposase
MPDHMQGIVWLQPANSDGPTLARLMQWFKTMTTNAYIRGVRDEEWSPFDRRLWQRDYYEHIVRDQASLERIRAYIKRGALNIRSRSPTDTRSTIGVA